MMDSLLLSALVLGMAHGFVPDEHSWPPLLAYAVGARKDLDMFKAHLTFGMAHLIPWIPIFMIAGVLGTIIIKEEYEQLFNLFSGTILLFLGLYSFSHPKHIHLEQKKEFLSPLLLGIILGFAPCLFTLSILGLVLIRHSLELAILAAWMHGIGITISVVCVGWIARKGVNIIRRRKDLCEKFGILGSAILFGTGCFLILFAIF
jgi:sulfite exporter TauE/SafE